ncbi:MAG: phosphotransferase family protein [Kangiellaceae bacterium]|jgi:aminoglycoside phosphotransferase (APT) family kinase protein|nr:phosphotransferase family protein [Kangiellaceae bacterium]
MSTDKPKSFNDRAGQVKVGEELPVEKVDAWLKSQGVEVLGGAKVTQYSGGASNWTYCLSYDNRELILRRAPAGTKAKGAHDMAREFNIQSALKSSYSYVPEMIGLCQDESVVGTDFYIMEKLNGIIPRKNMPRGLSLDKQQVSEMCKHVLDCFIELHQVDYKANGLDNLAKGAGYVDRQIDGWSERYKKAKTWNVPSAKYVMNWLSDNRPTNETICLIHNDFRFDNVVLDSEQPTKVIGVLDWEMATLGDPLMDLGNTLAYWVEPDDDFMAQATRRQPTHLSGMMTRQQVIEYYCDKMNFKAEDFKFYEAYGLFRLAVIVQQIYYRYHYKQTRNPTFKRFWLFVHYLLWRSKKVIKRK